MGLLETLEGSKTYIGGIGAILVGAGQLAFDWYKGEIKPMEYYATWVIAGWTIISARSAVKKGIGE